MDDTPHVSPRAPTGVSKKPKPKRSKRQVGVRRDHYSTHQGLWAENPTPRRPKNNQLPTTSVVPPPQFPPTAKARRTSSTPFSATRYERPIAPAPARGHPTRSSLDHTPWSFAEHYPGRTYPVEEPPASQRAPGPPTGEATNGSSPYDSFRSATNIPHQTTFSYAPLEPVAWSLQLEHTTPASHSSVTPLPSAHNRYMKYGPGHEIRGLSQSSGSVPLYPPSRTSHQTDAWSARTDLDVPLSSSLLTGSPFHSYPTAVQRTSSLELERPSSDMFQYSLIPLEAQAMECASCPENYSPRDVDMHHIHDTMPSHAVWSNESVWASNSDSEALPDSSAWNSRYRFPPEP